MCKCISKIIFKHLKIVIHKGTMKSKYPKKRVLHKLGAISEKILINEIRGKRDFNF